MSNEYYVPDNDNDWQALFLKREGRLNRLRYFKRQLILIGISMFLLIFVMIVCDNGYGFITKRGESLIIIINLCNFGVSYFLDVRRLHDLDKDSTIASVILAAGVISNFDSLEGLANIGELVTIAGMLYLFFAPGSEGHNKYGPNPLGPTMAANTANAANTGNAEQGASQNIVSDIIDAVSNLTGNSKSNLVGGNGSNNLPNPGVNTPNSPASDTNINEEYEEKNDGGDDEGDDDDIDL